MGEATETEGETEARGFAPVASYARRTDKLPQLTDRLTLGDGLKVSPFCLGLVSDPKTVAAAYEAGINFFFVTADMHWPLYEGIRKGLGQLLRDKPSVRDDIVVAGVSYTTQPEFCWYPYQELLDEVPELGGRLDVTVAGGAYRGELKTRRMIYQNQRQTSYLGVKGVGVTFHDRLGITDRTTQKIFDVVYVRYNPDHTGAQREVFNKLPKKRQSLLFNFKSTSGFVSSARAKELGVDDDFWRPHISDYYRFALTPAAMDGILCSLALPAHVTALDEALKKGPLTGEEEQFMIDLSDLHAGRIEIGEDEEEAKADEPKSAEDNETADLTG